MSLTPQPIQPVPEATLTVARAAFPQGTPCLTLRDELGTLLRDEDFSDLFPLCGQPSVAPWRLALVTILPFRENLCDRQAVEAVRARIDWKYLLGLELTDPGFDFSVRSEFRTRLVAGQAEERLWRVRLEQCRSRGLVKAGGRQRTDSTPVLASVRELNRLELSGETLRAALKEIATLEPQWLHRVTPPAWYDRYSQRSEDSRLPRTPAKRQAYAQSVGEEGLALVKLVAALEAPAPLKHLPQVRALRTAWARHFAYDDPPSSGGRPGVRFNPHRELAQAEERIESPYDPEARFRSKSGLHWTGYRVHLSESCDEESVQLITHVHTTTAAVHEALCTEPIPRALSDKGLPAQEHLADAGYSSAELLFRSPTEYGIELIGPPRENPRWQSKVEGAYPGQPFQIDWEHRVVHCPQGVTSAPWRDYVDASGKSYHRIGFPKQTCQACSQRALCTKTNQQPRRLSLHSRPQHEALQRARALLESEEEYQRYARRHALARRARFRITTLALSGVGENAPPARRDRRGH